MFDASFGRAVVGGLVIAGVVVFFFGAGVASLLWLVLS